MSEKLWRMPAEEVIEFVEERQALKACIAKVHTSFKFSR